MEDQTIVQSDLPPAPAGEATRVLSATPTMGYAPAAPYGDATQQALTVTCPVCQTPNPPSERYCQDCGLLFGSATDVEPLEDASQLPRLLDSTGREFVLNAGVNTVGRENADILLIDPTVSRRHAQVALEETRIIVEDLGSTNGSYVGANPTRAGQRTEAYDGDTVRFGSVSLTLALPGGAARPASAAPAAAPTPAPQEDRGEPVAQLVLGDGTEFPLYEGVNTLGRRSGNQIVLADAFASGRHAEIRCNPDGTAELVDVGSTNGTFIAGERLAPNTPVTLEEGTTVTFGKTPVTFRRAAPAAADATVAMPPSEPAPEVDDFLLTPTDPPQEGAI